MYKSEIFAHFRLLICLMILLPCISPFHLNAQISKVNHHIHPFQPSFALNLNDEMTMVTLTFEEFPGGDVKVHFFNHSNGLVKVFRKSELPAGKLVFKIDVSSLPPDTYKLEVRTSKGLEKRKLTLQSRP